MPYPNNFDLSFWFDCVTNKQTLYKRTGLIFKLMAAQLMKIFCRLSNPHLTYRVCKGPPLVPILGQMDLIHALTSCLFKDNIQISHINGKNRKMY